MRTTMIRLSLAAALCASLSLAAGPSASPAQFQKAPLNPKFVKGNATAAAQGVSATRDASGRILGYRPGPTIIPPRPVDARRAQTVREFPASFDLRAIGKVTPVRDQNPYGTCWAFGTYGSLESNLLTAENWDFSENNLANWSGYDWGFNDGGNAWLSAGYLARWGGPYDDTEDPYPAPGFVPPSSASPKKHVQNIDFLPARVDFLDNATIKQALTDSGALYCAFYYDNRFLSAGTSAYYCPTGDSANHAVTLVGWDDNYDKSNFLITPEGNGAFLIKNSWGDGWGDNGYFWLSYYDTSFCEIVLFNGAEPVDSYACAYGYDPLGWVTSFGPQSSETAWGANIFTAYSTNPLAAVSFFTTSADCAYELSIHTDVKAGEPRGGTLAASKTGSFAACGYHTVKLDAPVSVTPGSRFSVVLKLTTPMFNYPLAIESVIIGYSSHAFAEAGQSFVSIDGEQWDDLVTVETTANLCIKVFCAGQAPSGSHSVAGSLKGLEESPVTLTLCDSGMIPVASATMTADGSFSFAGLRDGIYILTPSGGTYDYKPKARTVTVAGTAVEGLDFIAAPKGIDVAIGVEFSIPGTFTTKPKVYIKDAKGKTVAAKVPTPFSIVNPTCVWTAKVNPTGTYTLYCSVGGSEAKTVTTHFNILPPKADNVEWIQKDASLWATGFGFGASIPKITLAYTDAKGKTKSLPCKLPFYIMSSDGFSYTEFSFNSSTYQKLVAAGITHFTVVIKNSLGEDRSWSIDGGIIHK